MNPCRKIILLVLAAALSLTLGCACKRCEQEKERLVTQWGRPESSEVARSGHLITETWFYTEAERSVIFQWDERECGCDVNTFFFDDGEPAGEFSFSTRTSMPTRP